MAVNSIGDMAQTFMLRRQTTRMKQEASVAAQELTTGYTANVGRKLGGDLTRVAGLEVTLSRLKGYRHVTDMAAMTSNAMQSVLGQIDALTENMGPSVLNASNMESPRILDTFLKEGTANFKAVLASLNSKVGDRTLFAGIATNGPAVASSDVILAALEAAISGAGAVTAEDMETAVTAWFDDPAGFASIGYLGGAASAPIAVSAEDRADLGVTAMDPAIRGAVKSLAMIALADRGTVIPNPETGLKFTRLAGSALMQNQSDRTYLAGQIGLSQARIEQAQTRNEAEGAALRLARSDLLAVDPYEAATRMEAAQTQLETLYSVTARLSRLRLVDFLR